MNDKGIVFNIQRFTTHDGPGIRTTVFLKGCPLTCHWCSNPESQYGKPQLMIRDIKCSGCGACITACPEQAIRFSKNGTRQISWESCNHCFDCVDACLYQALTAVGQYMSVNEVIEIIEKDSVFYRNSNGGVTFSGGEVLTQPHFLEKLLTKLKSKDIHTCIDTTGFAPEHMIKKVLPHTDLVMFDIKHLDNEKHKQGTGVENSLILKNLKYITGIVPTWIRIPLIPGYNDDVEHISKVAALASGLGVEKVSLLPYHEGGISKADQIGMHYHKKALKPQSNEHLNLLENILISHNLFSGIRH